MTIEGYARLVAEMRAVQRRFFRGDKSYDVVATAKRLEQQVDVATTDILEPDRQRQRSMFGEEGR